MNSVIERALQVLLWVMERYLRREISRDPEFRAWVIDQWPTPDDAARYGLVDPRFIESREPR